LYHGRNIRCVKDLQKDTITVDPIYEILIDSVICEGNFPFMWNNIEITEAGEYTYNGMSSLGCDSILILTVTESEIITVSNDTAVCVNNFPFLWREINILGEGLYRDTVISSLACDTVFILNVTENEIITVYKDSAVCVNNFPFMWRGINILGEGEYRDTVQGLIGCDTIYILNVTEKQLARYEYSHSICMGDTYPFGGQNLTTGGIYYNTLTGAAANGCDSIVTLNLSVESSIITNENLSLCTHQFPYEYRDTVFGVNTVAGIYIFVDGCSRIELDLKIVKLPEINIPEMIVCAGEPYVTFDITPVSSDFSHGHINYSVEFNAQSLAAGFVNQSGTISGTDIDVALPGHIYPNHYGLTLTLTSDDDCNAQTVIPVPFSILYPRTIMEQKWDDVIALLNRYYNCLTCPPGEGYDFAAYQWYRNSNIMHGEDYSYIYLPNGGVLNNDDCYQVEITRPDGTKMFSCCFYPHDPKTECCVYPIVVQDGVTIRVSSLPNNVSLRLWTVTGILIQTHKDINSAEYEFAAPQQQGIYLIEMFTPDYAFKKVFPIVVK